MRTGSIARVPFRDLVWMAFPPDTHYSGLQNPAGKADIEMQRGWAVLVLDQKKADRRLIASFGRFYLEKLISTA